MGTERKQLNSVLLIHLVRMMIRLYGTDTHIQIKPVQSILQIGN